MSTKFIKHGDGYYPANEESLVIGDRLESGVYVVTQDPMDNLYFKHAEEFSIPSRVYGNLEGIANRILHTFRDRYNNDPPKSTGVLLSGDKGDGKTLLSKIVSARSKEKYDMPTILVNQPFKGNEFNALIDSVTQPCVVIFDEFEKVYKREDQDHVLTLLDGVCSSSKLFIFTCNDSYLISDHMMNRPGRIYYALHFSGADLEFIRSYCNENLRDKSLIEDICGIALGFHSFNFDMLASLVEELNRHGGTVEEAMVYLNINHDYETQKVYRVAVIGPKGETFATEETAGGDAKYDGTPISGFTISMYTDKHWELILFPAASLKERNTNDGSLVFRNREGWTATLTPTHGGSSVRYDRKEF